MEYHHKAYKIPSGAMKPTLLIGDHLIVNKRAYQNEKPLRGDIVVFKWPKDESKNFIKRVIGIEGDTVEIKRDVLYINGERIKTEDAGKYSDERLFQTDKYKEFLGEGKQYYILNDSNIDGLDYGPITVPEDSIFVLGDNRDNSQDSRHWSFVSLNKIRGKALYLYWAKDKSRLGLQIQ